MILGIIVTLILIAIVFWALKEGSKMEEEEKKAGEQGNVLDSILKNRYQLLLRGLNYINETELASTEDLIAIAEYLKKSEQRFGQTTLQRNITNANMNKAIRTMKKIAKETPELQQQEKYQMFMSLLEEGRGELQMATAAYNEHVQKYNALLHKLPTSIVGELIGKLPLEVFQNVQ